ncbi:hypothetical protein QVD17_05222 [Tagetes erecta]|uniref:Uncharacterized protein n=1 Tax=Tagetes erecta TaxID=13708 RepID=A0AAD8LEM2_TARER|nr:hypothetical protein QVD17_05222 [Tagetes erecta]
MYVHDKMKKTSYASLGKYRKNRLWVSCKGTFLRVTDIDFSSFKLLITAVNVLPRSYFCMPHLFVFQFRFSEQFS